MELKGKKILITAGPTQEAIDPVRYISNHSSGKMGYAIAEALHNQGADVIVVSGPVSISTSIPSDKIELIRSADEMLAACRNYFSEIDVAIFAAAVADYKPAFVNSSKIKKESEPFTINLIPNPDIALEFSKVKTQQQVSIGFALETDDLIANGRKKLLKKKFNYIILNSPHESGSGFGYDTNQIKIMNCDGHLKDFQLKSKQEVAADIINECLVNSTLVE